ncbi:MAG: hypothetical protein ACREV9_04665 [Burkholderiales bacterium]
MSAVVVSGRNMVTASSCNVAHRVTVLVACLHQHRKQIITLPDYGFAGRGLRRGDDCSSAL